jgi:hypothetical protein
MPKFEFCLPTLGKAVPAGPEWFHEIKYDGYRLRIERDGGPPVVRRDPHHWRASVAVMKRLLHRLACWSQKPTDFPGNYRLGQLAAVPHRRHDMTRLALPFFFDLPLRFEPKFKVAI